MAKKMSTTIIIDDFCVNLKEYWKTFSCETNVYISMRRSTRYDHVDLLNLRIASDGFIYTQYLLMKMIII